MHYAARYCFLTGNLLLLFALAAAAQQPIWTDIFEESIHAQQADRLIIPNRYRTLQLDFGQLRQLLQTAPAEADWVQGTPGLLLDFPMPDGGLTTFEVWEAPVMAPELTAQYPDIRSFAGKSLDHRGTLARFDISPAGLHAMFLVIGGSSVFIDPYARGNTAAYICYFKRDFVKRDGSVFTCAVADPVEPPEVMATGRSAGDCGFRREYRLALACTGEYANFQGSTGTNKAPALAAMNTSMTRVNGVFERDAGIRMIMVANTVNLIYTDPATDPYTNNNGSTMLGENQTTCDAVIGSANYDIGHVFSTGGGGVAYLGATCNGSIKAGGVTGSPSPVGDPFDIDYVAHEMGHQYGANHTQYNNCNRNNATAMEPGSASSIMGYAGICAPNVQDHSDDYFHGISLQEIGAFVTGSGNGCSVHVTNGNNAPVAGAVIDRTVPKSTPFVLSGSATDPNGDALSFCWEEMDPKGSGTKPMPPQSGNSNGPMFRTLNPVFSGSRYFPNYDSLLAGINPIWEELPSVARTMNFRLTVRDNHPGGGCTTEKNLVVTTSGTTGPFQLVTPNGGESYPGNSTQTVTWNVANTTASPVSCATVDILLSTDGGANYNYLISGTANDGSEPVTLPNSITSTARVKVQAVGNVFFAVSNSNFSITQALPIELAAFGASLQNGAVRLDWSTESERNNRGFQIERSIDNAAGFQPLGWVAGQGNTSVRHNYSYTDTGVQPGHTYYYRLRQSDFDGQESYSDVRAVAVEGSAETLNIHPNPAKDMIRVQLLNAAGAAALLLDAQGRIVREMTLQPGATEIDVAGLPGGMYYLQVKSGQRLLRGSFYKS